MATRRKNLTEQAEDFLRVVLADGPVAAKEVERLVEEQGWITRTTLMRAKTRVGVVSRKSRDAMGSWSWELPAE